MLTPAAKRVLQMVLEVLRLAQVTLVDPVKPLYLLMLAADHTLPHYCGRSTDLWNGNICQYLVSMYLCHIISTASLVPYRFKYRLDGFA
jgi:hypothetical protein